MGLGPPFLTQFSSLTCLPGPVVTAGPKCPVLSVLSLSRHGACLGSYSSEAAWILSVAKPDLSYSVSELLPCSP